MSLADQIFINMCRDILENGTSTEGEEVCPRWPDGEPAYTIKKFGVVNRYDLSREAVHGFALWFLLLPAYLPLWIAGAFAWCAGVRLSFAGHEALALGAFDAAQALIVWAGVTFYTFRLRRPSIPHHARNFVRIVIFWGLFQLLCGAALGLWEHGGLAALHDCPRGSESTVTTPDRQ